MRRLVPAALAVLVLAVVGLGVSLSAGAVTPVTPVGIATCDAFLAAYAQCAASPSVPDAVRPGLRQSINTTREGFRTALAGHERARMTVEFQCAQAHGVIRERLVTAYGCDFPAPSPAAAALAAQAPSPARSGSIFGR